MQRSFFISGLSGEQPESALGQVLLWDGMTIGTGLRRALLRHLQGSSWPEGLQGNLREALERLQGHLQKAPEREAAWINEFQNPLDPQAMKLCRLLDHHGISIAAGPDIGTLHAYGQKIQDESIRKAQGQRDAAGNQTPEVRTIEDLVPHVLRQLFANLENWLAKASPEERERVAEQIAKALDHLGADVQEEVKRVAGLDDLAMETLVRGGGLAALGTGLAAVTGVGGFAVYATLSATIANIVVLVGLTLPFSAYIVAASLLAFASNPLVISAAIVGGSAWWTTKVNRRMHDELVPLLVAFAVLKSADPTARSRSRGLVEHLADRYREFLYSDRDQKVKLRRAFPAFRHPEESERAGWSSRRL